MSPLSRRRVLAGLVAILTTAAGLQGINDPAQSARVLATAPVPPPSEIPDRVASVPASPDAVAKAGPPVTPMAVSSAESFVSSAELPSARAAGSNPAKKLGRDDPALGAVADRPRSPA